MKKVVTIGGGTGNFVALSGLRKYGLDLSAIVTMSDDGGSTGILRDELGVLPPGDVRQCLVALSDSGRLMRDLMNYRFEYGCLEGHSFGNILLSALEKVTGSFEKAIEETGKIINIKGKVIPVTVHPVRLRMILQNNKILESQKEIFISSEIDKGYRNVYLDPSPQANMQAISEIMGADLVALGPGDLYSSLIPNLLVEGISKALRDTKAKKVFVINLMNKKGQTTNFTVGDYVREIKRFVGRDVFDFLIVNTKKPSLALMKKYASEKSVVENDLNSDPRVILADVLGEDNVELDSNDVLAGHRSFIRHDPHKLAAELMKIVDLV